MLSLGAIPQKCFISHSYRDGQSVSRLLALLSGVTEPFIFPVIKVPPKQLVSNSLIQAILNCDGLIYLKGGHSATSFWVAFERDYAIRAGKPVYGFDPQTNSLLRDTQPPTDLLTYLSYSWHDHHKISQIENFMRTERYFDSFRSSGVSLEAANVPLKEEIRGELRMHLELGGIMIVFWSLNSKRSPWVNSEWKAAFAEYPQQILPALLDPSPLPNDLCQLDPVQLYSNRERRANQRIDDLIVCLYWLLYRKNRHYGLD